MNCNFFLLAVLKLLPQLPLLYITPNDTFTWLDELDRRWMDGYQSGRNSAFFSCIYAFKRAHCWLLSPVKNLLALFITFIYTVARDLKLCDSPECVKTDLHAKFQISTSSKNDFWAQASVPLSTFFLKICFETHDSLSQIHFYYRSSNFLIGG